LWDWIKLFTITTEGELEIMENVQTTGVQKAAVVIRQMNADDRLKEIARIHEKAKMTEFYALKNSREEGIEQGRQEGVLMTAKNLLSLGVPFDLVIKSTGLSEAELRAL
jgi:predicted transposase/invertase (TIGR01784 family)